MYILGMFLFLLIYLTFLTTFKYGQAQANAGCLPGGQLAFGIVEAALILAFFFVRIISPNVTEAAR